MLKTKRTFIIGDEWIYFKLYTGIKTADLILIDFINDTLKEFIENSFIDQWFFIRYSDPNFHIRVRLHLTDKKHFVKILNSLNLKFTELMQLDLIWNVQTDTYNRELERYGSSIIEQSEFIFYQDSIMIVDALKIIDNYENNYNDKWLFGLVSIDEFLNDFQFSLFEKMELMKNLKISFGEEMGLGKLLKKQLNVKYQKYKIDIYNAINHNVDEKFNILKNLINNKSNATSNSIKIIKTNPENHLNLNYIIGSHIHMTMNRLFRNKNRQTEFVCYYMLYHYYESKIARMKYNK